MVFGFVVFWYVVPNPYNPLHSSENFNLLSIFFIMRIIFSNHALVRMLERAISEDHVKEVLKSPDFAVETSNGRYKASRKIGKKVYSVIFKRERDKIIIITIF